MKTLSLYLTIVCVAFTGCGKKEDPAAAVAEAAPSVDKVVEEAAAQETTMVETADALVASGVETVKEVIPEVAESVDAMADAAKAKADAMVADMPKESGDGMVAGAVGAAAAVASNVDFSNMSWDQVSNVGFADKLNLASWATGQADSWKGKLTEAAKGQGLNMLSKMGDTGWQGSLKTVMESVKAVQESSPETFEMARGALVSAWGIFEEQASAFLAK